MQTDHAGGPKTLQPSQAYLDYLGEKLYASPEAVEAMIELYLRMKND